MLEQAAKLLLDCGTTGSVMPATQLYNEGWLLRLTLSCIDRLGIANHPLGLQEGARWYSEALLRSRFLAVHRGDPLAESWTHADGVIGHFEVRGRDGGVVVVTGQSRQFIVAEAKLFSRLSPGTTRAKEYDQAARNVACMIETIANADCKIGSFSSLGFYVLAPQSQYDAGVFGDLLEKERIRERVRRRVAAYDRRSDATAKQEWLREWFEPGLARLEIGFLSWERLIDDISQAESNSGEQLQQFYAECLRFNTPRQAGAAA